jgi:hypothetical protein
MDWIDRFVGKNVRITLCFMEDKHDPRRTKIVSGKVVEYKNGVVMEGVDGKMIHVFPGHIELIEEI